MVKKIPKVQDGAEKIKINNDEYLNDFRKELCDWFDNNAPPLSELYRGALALLYGSHRIPGWQVFVCHSVREIRNRLPEAIQGKQSGKFNGTFEYKNELNRLSELWKENGLPIGDKISEDAELEQAEVCISRPLFDSIKLLLQEHEKVGDKISEKAKVLFESYNAYYQSSPIPVAKEWLKVTDWFVDHVHINASQKKQLDESLILERFEVFERIVGAIIRSFFHTIGELDEILEETNS